MSARRPLLALAALATLLLAPAATTATSPDPALLPPPRHATAIFKGATIKGIVALLWTSGQDGRLEAAFKGLSPRKNYRLVASRQPCGTKHDASSGALSWPNIDGGAVSRSWAHRPVQGLLPFVEQQAILSFRLVRTTAPVVQVACAPANRYYDQSQISSPTAYELKDVLISSYSGFISITRPAADGFSLNFEEIKQFSGKRRVVGSSQPCGTPTTGGSAVFSYGYNGSPDGTFRRNLALPLGSSDPLALQSVRLYQGTSGFSKPAGCSGIIAILIGL